MLIFTLNSLSWCASVYRYKARATKRKKMHLKSITGTTGEASLLEYRLQLLAMISLILRMS